MRQNTEFSEIRPVKGKSAGRKILTVILVLLLIPVLLAGLMLLYLNVADFKYDDPQKVADTSVPMSFSERSSFDPDEVTRTMRFDKADIYFLLRDRISQLRFDGPVGVNAYRLALDERAIYLRGRVYGIKIPIRLDLDMKWDKGNIILDVKGASLGSLGIPLPLKLIAEKAGVGLEYTLPLKGIPDLETAEDIYLKDGYLNVVYPVDKNIISEGLDAWPYLRPAAFYLTQEDDMIALMEDFQENWTVDAYQSEKLKEFMKKLKAEPGLYQKLKVSMLASAPEKTVEEYFSSERFNADTMGRFYPGINKKAVDEMRKQLHYSQNYQFILNYAFSIDEQFGQKAITVRNGSFIDTKSGKKIDIYKAYKDSPEVREVFPEGTRLSAVLCEGTDSRQKIGNIYYGCGTAVRFPNGRCAVIGKSDRKLYFMEIQPEEFQRLESGSEKVYIVAFKG